MKKYKTDEIRNLCFLSHSGVGKTSLIEAMCRACGAPGASGSVDKGTSLFDSRPDEKSRKMTISSGVASMDWKGNKINIIDTPGSLGLLAEANGGIRVSEMSCVLVDAVSGIEVGTEQSTRMIDKYAGRKTFFINGIDKENADFDKTLDSLKQKYGTSVAPVQIPIGSGESFKGIVDLLSGKAFEYSGDKGVGKETEVPSDISESVESIRNSLIESIAESDEELMEKYFEAGELSDDDLKNGLAKGVAQGLIFPLFCGSAAKGMGVDLLLDSIVSISPSPMVDKEMGILKGDETIKVSAVSEDKARAFVFKTVSEEHVGEINYIRLFSGTLKGGEHLKNMTTGNEERLSSLYSICGNKREEVQELQAGDIGGVIKLKETHTSDTLVDPSLDERFEPIDYGDRLV
ncbi:MAG: GTP-binding protein, partial [Chitinivibrionales bacterium]